MIANFHIEQPGSHLTQWYLQLISLLSKIAKRIRLKRLKWGIVRRANKMLYKIYVESEGLKGVVKNSTIESAKGEHKKAIKALTVYRTMYEWLEDVDFFNNSDTKEIAENSLANFYYLERYLRRLSFSGNCEGSEDKNLLEFASALSLGSLNESINAPKVQSARRS